MRIHLVASLCVRERKTFLIVSDEKDSSRGRTFQSRQLRLAFYTILLNRWLARIGLQTFPLLLPPSRLV